MEILVQSAFLVAFVALALGVSVLTVNIRNKLFRAYGAMAAVIFGWGIGYFLESIVPDAEGVYHRLHLFFHVWISPAAILFLQVMVRMNDGISRTLLWLNFLVSLGLSVAIVFQIDFFPVIHQLIKYSLAPLGIQIFHLLLVDRNLIEGFKKRRQRLSARIQAGGRLWVYLGGILVCTLVSFSHSKTSEDWIPALGYVGIAIYLYFLSQAITDQRLLHFETMVSRFFVLLGFSVVLTGIYSILFIWIKDRPAIFFLNSMIISFLLLVLLDPIQSFVSYLSKKVIPEKYSHLDRVIEGARRKLSGPSSLEEVFDILILMIEQSVEPQSISLFVLSDNGTQFKRVRVTGRKPAQADPSTEVSVILSNHRLIQKFSELDRNNHDPVVLEHQLESEADRATNLFDREKLNRLLDDIRLLDANVFIPLIDSHQVLGFVACDVNAPPAPWENNWGFLKVLYPFFGQVAGVLRNMEIYKRQRETERLASLGEMSAGLAHEIRNPLGAIKGAVQFLDPESDRKDARFLKIIVDEVDRLNGVVSQFLDYSKPHAVEFEKTEINALVERAIQVLRAEWGQKQNIEFFPYDMPLFLHVAGVQIHQVVLNLVRNAMQSIQNHGIPNYEGKISVKVDIEDDEFGNSSWIVISVEDNGPGISLEDQKKIFVPFFTTSKSGTGLGLPICQKIIQAHRGRIELESEPGVRTRFSVYLPQELDVKA